MFATSTAGTTTSVSLETGERYLIKAEGTWTWDNRVPGRFADAECYRHPHGSGFPGEPDWDRGGLVDDGFLDLTIDGTTVDWITRSPTIYGCNEATHTYETHWVQVGNKPITLRIRDTYYPDNEGFLLVTINKVASASGSTTNSALTSPTRRLGKWFIV